MTLTVAVRAAEATLASRLDDVLTPGQATSLVHRPVRQPPGPDSRAPARAAPHRSRAVLFRIRPQRV